MDINYESLDSNEAYVEGKNIYYTSGEVAKMVGISRDMVRYYTDEFKEFMNVEKTKGNHLRYKGEDIETLRLILTLLKKHTPAETKAILSDKDVRLVYANTGDEEQGFLKLLMMNNKYLADQLNNLLTQTSQALMIERKESEDAKYEKLINEMVELKEENKELKNMLYNVLEKLDETNKKKGFLGIFKR